MSDGQTDKSTCIRCGMTIRRFHVVGRNGTHVALWLGLIKGEWIEACPSSFLLKRRHKPKWK